MFKEFTGTKIRFGTPKISIWAKNRINFNEFTNRLYKISENYNYAVLYFNEIDRKIGIHLTNNPEKKGCAKLIKTKKMGVSFYASNFIKLYKIDNSKTKKYNFEYDKNTKMFIIDLNQ